MVQRALSNSVRDNLQHMLYRFAGVNERTLPESDKHILQGMVHEIQSAENVELSVKLKKGKVHIQCNKLKYQFDDPTTKV